MPPRDLPAPERYPHGVRAKYVSGCRCASCTTANRLYARSRVLAIRRGGGNDLVDAAPVCRHLRNLRRQGVGTRAVMAAADVGRTAVQDLRSGKKITVRRLTAERILKVTAGHRADHSLVPKAPTLARVRWLVAQGYSRAAIARGIGSDRALNFLYQPGPKITAIMALRVRQFYLRAKQ